MAVAEAGAHPQCWPGTVPHNRAASHGHGPQAAAAGKDDIEPTLPFPNGPTGAELLAAGRLLASWLFELIERHWPPWWAWLACATVLVLLGLLVRSRSLRALEVAVPDAATRSRAVAAGQALAASGPIGLVLGGGGAKGAYQIGCWQALRESGIDRFGALAGTSVGALNAVLVAQDDFDRAVRIWHDMGFGRVLRLRWCLLPLAVAVRLLLFIPYLGKFAFPARFIPVALFRAVDGWQAGLRSGELQISLRAVVDLYLSFARSPTSTDTMMNQVLAGIMVAGLSAGWMLAAPLISLVALLLVVPFVVLLVVSNASGLASMLDQLATRFVLASNGPLAELLRDCVDPARLQARPQPVFVTLSFLGEVTHPRPFQLPQRLAAQALKPKEMRRVAKRAVDVDVDADFGSALPKSILRSRDASIDYLPRHFDVRGEGAVRMRELILQSAGLPEIFPARHFDGVSYVDGGLADNEPLSALAGQPAHAAVIVIPLNARGDEAKVRADLDKHVERSDRRDPEFPPRLVVLTPSRSLGGLLTGTMDFGARRARAMMRLGYRDTIVSLARLEPAPQTTDGQCAPGDTAPKQ